MEDIQKVSSEHPLPALVARFDALEKRHNAAERELEITGKELDILGPVIARKLRLKTTYTTPPPTSGNPQALLAVPATEPAKTKRKTPRLIDEETFLLAIAEGHRTADDIATVLGASRSSACNWLTKLHREGKVTRKKMPSPIGGMPLFVYDIAAEHQIWAGSQPARPDVVAI